MHPESTSQPADAGDVVKLRDELLQAQAEIERLGARLALRERERDLQRRFEAYKEEKRKTEEEAQKLRELYNSLLFENNPNTLFLFDENLRYVLGSRRFLVDSMPEDLVGKPLQEVFAETVDPAWIGKILRQCMTVIETQQLWRYNDALQLGDAEPLEVQIVISPVVQESGECRGVLIAINDVSELAEARTRAEAADRLKSSFLAQMSHEIRTPMNAIVGITEIMLHDSSLAPAQRKYVTDIRISSSTLLTIINDILDFSKLDSGKMTLLPVHFQFRTMLHNIASIMTFMAAEKRIAFHLETGEGIPECLYGDDVRIRQILLNLLGNAIKFTLEGEVVLKVEVDEGMLVFTVRDTGIGIRKEELGMLFEAFKQVNRKKSRQIEGTGLGLSISRSLVELMNGAISVDSHYGQGSAFVVRLPMTKGDPAKVVRQTVRNGGDLYSRDTRILVVDDNEINLNVASGLLKTLHGLDCEMALSGPEALAKAARKRYHLIFMDHMMPDMDGVETTVRLRAMGGHNAKVPIVALTANAVSGAREMLTASSMDDFLAKPVDKAELARVLRTWLPEELRLPDEVAPEEDVSVEAVEYSDALARMMAIDELDVNAGLEMMAGDQAGYEQSLRLLCRRIPEVNSRMESQLFGDLDLGGFGVDVHGLKGSLASVGARNLSRQAQQLEAAALALDSGMCRSDYPRFSSRLLKLAHEIEAAFGIVVGNTTRRFARDGEATRVFSKLKQALSAYDYDAVTSELEVARRLDFGPAANATLARIRTLVDSFDYEAAAHELSPDPD